MGAKSSLQSSQPPAASALRARGALPAGVAGRPVARGPTRRLRADRPRAASRERSGPGNKKNEREVFAHNISTLHYAKLLNAALDGTAGVEALHRCV